MIIIITALNADSNIYFRLQCSGHFLGQRQTAQMHVPFTIKENTPSMWMPPLHTAKAETIIGGTLRSTSCCIIRFDKILQKRQRFHNQVTCNYVILCSEGFPLPLGAWDRLCYIIVALPGPSI